MELEIDKMKLDDASEATGWFDMPYEMRRIVIDLMDLQTKGRFSRCSMDCYEEVCLSKNVAYFLEISDIRHKLIDAVHVHVAPNRNYDDEEQPFILPGRSLVVYNTTVAPENENALAFLRRFYDEEVLFEVDSKEQLTEFIIQNCRGLLKILKSSLNYLYIDMDDFPYDQIKLGNLNGWQTLHLSANIKNNQIDPIRSGFIDFEQLRLIQEDLHIPSLTVDQLFQLKARSIGVGYGGGELYDLDQILNRIIDGELDGNVKSITVKPKNCVENISGLFAKGLQLFLEEYLVKRMDKMIRINVLPSGIIIYTKVLTEIDQTNDWIIL